jgi:hypothetical protein
MSCTSVFFDHPQPVNSKNIEIVPEEIRGKWTEVSKYQQESITIDRSSFKKVTVSFNHIHKSDADSGYFRIADGKIFLFSEDFKKGNPFKLLNDTIYYTQHSQETFVLSDSVLLRRAKNCYVLNTRKNNWWEIFFIRKNKNGEISISYPISAELIELKSKYNLMVLDSTREDTVRFHADFKAGNIEKILNKDDEGLIWTLNRDSTFRSNF